MNNNTTVIPEIPEVLSEISSGFMKTQAVYSIAKLGIAEYLSDGPKSSEALAEIIDVDPAALYRLLRAVESIGFFTEPQPGIFALTPLGEYLNKDTPGGFYNQIIMNCELFYNLWGELIYTVKSGRSADQKVYGKSFFEYLQQHSEQTELFNKEMTNFISTMAPAIVAAYDFNSFGTIVDIGGGHGTLMAVILQANPQVQGIIFDLPITVNGAQQRFNKIGLSKRCKFVGGDFFESLPAANCMILSAIISDWNDEQSARILSNCRRPIAPDGRLLLLERLVIPEEPAPPTAFLDLAMLLAGGGTGRSKKEYQKLLADSGFDLIRVIPTGTQRSIFEAKPV
jgi:SAM-dependent methyltransferase